MTPPLTTKQQRLIREALQRLESVAALCDAIERGLVALAPISRERGAVLANLGFADQNQRLAAKALRALLEESRG